MYGKVIHCSLSDYDSNELKEKNPKLDNESYKVFSNYSNARMGNLKVNKVKKPSYKLLESHDITLTEYDSLYYFNDDINESTLLFCIEKAYIHYNNVDWSKWQILKYVYGLNGKYIVNGILK